MKGFRFDSRDKKPALYWLLIPASAAALAVSVMISVDPAGSMTAACAVMATLCLCTVLGLIRALVRQMQYNLYSYNTIIYTGFALFVSFIFVTYVVLTVRSAKYPEVYQPLMILNTLLVSGKNYAVISSPFLILFSAALCVSNISLIRREGRRPVNLLGILLSFAVVGGAAFIFAFDFYASGSPTEVMIHDIIVNLFSAIYLYFECMLIGTIFADSVAARREPKMDKDFIIILGCGIREDGTPTPLLRGRIDRALAFANEQEKLTGKKATFVTSGGRGPTETISESESMKRYLTEHGVPEERIVTEDLSTDTFENMKFSKEKILQIDPDGKIAYSTTNYHVFRSGIFARRVKMRAEGMGAKTKWYFWPNAAVREFVGLLTNHRLKQALILGTMTVFYVVVTVLEYNL